MTTNETPVIRRDMDALRAEIVETMQSEVGLDPVKAHEVLDLLINRGYMGGIVEDGIRRWDGKGEVIDPYSASVMVKHGHGTHVQRISAGAWWPVISDHGE